MATMVTNHSYTLVEGRSSSPGTPSCSAPPSRDGPNKLQVSPANSDDSSLACDLSDLSFNYERGFRGEYVRTSKDSRKSSTPPTPSDSPPKAPSPVLAPTGYSRPAPLARSESMPQDSMYGQRQFQRATSLAITPAGTTRGFAALAPTNAGTGRKLGGPRRVPLAIDGIPDNEAQPKPTAPIGSSYGVDEKENQRAARLIRPARSLGKQLGNDRIAEVNEDVEPAPAPPYIPTTHHAIRPRRSASLSDAPPPIDPLPERPMVHLRTGNQAGPRRVTMEEKMRQERDIAIETEHARREAEEAAARAQAQAYPPAPSPTHIAPHLRHQRRDSDTMRNGSGSPTVLEAHRGRRSAPADAQRQSPLDEELQQQTKAAAAASTTKTFFVNKKVYSRLDQIGKGGSSRVYRVMTPIHEVFALKRVLLDKVDPDTISSYMNEIALLKRLDGNHRIIRLIDSEVRYGGGTKGQLFLVMECGEIDLAKLLIEKQKEPMDPVSVAYYWKQMLQAVQVIHEEKIVHSDLKPANFVLVKGQLKLIDFGIANAIANDTTNIQRDHQIGTVNYMSPEAIECPEGMRRLKVGRPSDVWSLGCILFQMVYGTTPFHSWSALQKMKIIPDKNHVIEFPEYAVPVAKKSTDSPPSSSPPTPEKLEHLKVRVPPAMIRTMKSCLARDQKARATIPELLEENWLETEVVQPPPPPPPSPPLTHHHYELKLKEEETIITPHYMKQLLLYGLRLGMDRTVHDWTDERLQEDATRLVGELKRINLEAAQMFLAQEDASENAS